MFFGPTACQLRCKIDKKTSPDWSKINQKICQSLDAIVDQFLTQLGSILGGFWRPSWSQVGTKWQQNPTPQPIKNMMTFWKASKAICYGFLVPTWPPRGVTFISKNLPFWVLLACGGHLGPKSLQTPQLKPKWPAYPPTWEPKWPKLTPKWPNISSAWGQLEPTWPTYPPTWRQKWPSMFAGLLITGLTIQGTVAGGRRQLDIYIYIYIRHSASWEGVFSSCVWFVVCFLFF